MAEEAKDSPSKGGRPPCEYPEGALDLLKKLTEGKPPFGDLEDLQLFT